MVSTATSMSNGSSPDHLEVPLSLVELDRELAGRSSGGESATESHAAGALAQILRSVKPLARRHGLDASTIDDLGQELFVRVTFTDATERFDPERGSLRVFLQWMARSVLRDLRRGSAAQVPIGYKQDPSCGDDPAARAEENEMHDRLRAAFQGLDPAERDALDREFGPLFDHGTSFQPRRKGWQSRAEVERAVEKLRCALAGPAGTH